MFAALQRVTHLPSCVHSLSSSRCGPWSSRTRSCCQPFCSRYGRQTHACCRSVRPQDGLGGRVPSNYPSFCHNFEVSAHLLRNSSLSRVMSDLGGTLVIGFPRPKLLVRLHWIPAMSWPVIGRAVSGICRQSTEGQGSQMPGVWGPGPWKSQWSPCEILLEPNAAAATHTKKKKEKEWRICDFFVEGLRNFSGTHENSHGVGIWQNVYWESWGRFILNLAGTLIMGVPRPD